MGLRGGCTQSGWYLLRCSSTEGFIFVADGTLHDIPQSSMSHLSVMAAILRTITLAGVRHLGGSRPATSELPASNPRHDIPGYVAYRGGGAGSTAAIPVPPPCECDSRAEARQGGLTCSSAPPQGFATGSIHWTRSLFSHRASPAVDIHSSPSDGVGFFNLTESLALVGHRRRWASLQLRLKWLSAGVSVLVTLAGRTGVRLAQGQS